MADVDAERANEAAAELTDAVALTADVREPGALDELVTRAADELGGLDILVTVVGGLAFVPGARIHETTEEDWDLMFDLNLRYVAPSASRAAPLPRAGQRRDDRRRRLYHRRCRESRAVGLGRGQGRARQPGQIGRGRVQR